MKSSAVGELDLLRSAFHGVACVREVKMFGGTAFLVNDHMAVAVSRRGLLVRVGSGEHDRALQRPGTRAMQMRGRLMTGYVYVDPVPNDARTLQSWVQSALRHNRTLPPKNTARAARGRRKTLKRRVRS